MKIAIDARESGTSTGRYIDKLIENLQLIDHENQYLILLPSKRMGEVEIQSANFQKAACDYKEFTFAEQIGFSKYISHLDVDLVHFGMIQQPYFCSKPSVTTMHDLTTVRFRNPTKSRLWYYFKLPPYVLIINRVVHRARAIITPTKYVMDDVISFTRHTPKLSAVTYESADKIKVPAEAISSLAGKKFIMYVGRPTPHKNLERLMDSYAELVKTVPDLQLVLAGKKDAVMTAHEERARSLGLKNVVVTGFVSEGELRWLYENCAAYVFPSLSEGFGLPGLEAMNHGAPVVSSNATCLPEVYGDAALYFYPLDILDMSQKILSVLTNKEVGDNLRTKGYEKAKEYSWERMARQTLEVYQKALPH